MTTTTMMVILGGVAVAGGLLMLGGWIAREFSGALPAILFGGLGATVIVWAVVQLMSGVFSVHGLAYSFGLAEAGDLTWPTAVRVTTLALTTELAALAVWAADHHADRGPRRPAHAWLWAHVSGPARIAWHGVLAPAMVLRDRVYRRAVRWPARPRHRFELAAVLGELVHDVGYGLAALPSAARRLEWRKLVKVTRTSPLPDTAEPFIVEGEATAGEVLRTWRALDAAPTPRDSADKART